MPGAELAGPLLRAGQAILAYEYVLAPCAGLAGQSAGGIPHQIDSRCIHGDAVGLIGCGRAELAGPHFRAGRVVQAHVRVESSRTGLTRQSARNAASDEDAQIAYGNGIGAAGAELAGKDLRTACVILA